MSEKQTIFEADEKDVLVYVKAYHKANPDEVIVFDEVFPLIDNTDFIDLILKEKFKFTSQNDQKWADKISSGFAFVSSKQAGNPNARLNTIRPANDFAKEMGCLLDYLDNIGCRTLEAKADFMNHYEITTLRGKEWFKTTVKRTQDRWKTLKVQSLKN